MTVTPSDLMLYAFGLFVLFLTPGPVWVAMIARGVSGGFASAAPLALGVVVGDVVWPFVAILGVSWVVSTYAGFMVVLKAIACGMFLWMGIRIIAHADHALSRDRRLTRPGKMAGFLAGVAVIMSNPKAIIFYMGVLPGFFDLAALTLPDMVAIATLSALVPLLGNLFLALMMDRAKRLLSSPEALRRMNVTAGALMICVGLVIPFT